MADAPLLFEFKGRLGAGGFDIANLVRHRVYGEVVFKKLIEATTCSDKEKFKEECEIHMKLNHRNIVKCLGIHFDSRTCGLFLKNMKYEAVDEFVEDHSVT